MDERYDLTYSVRDERYRYTRNYSSQSIYAQHGAYEWQSEAYQAWEQARMTGELNEVQSRFWKSKPVEEFYDIDSDPDSVNNLIDASAQRGRIAEMRRALDEHIVSTNDNGFIPEGVSIEGYDASRAPGVDPVREVLKIANLGLQRDEKNVPQFVKGLQDKNECIRYWSVQALVLMPKVSADTVAVMEQRLSSRAVTCSRPDALWQKH